MSSSGKNIFTNMDKNGLKILKYTTLAITLLCIALLIFFITELATGSYKKTDDKNNTVNIYEENHKRKNKYMLGIIACVIFGLFFGAISISAFYETSRRKKNEFISRNVSHVLSV